MTESGVAVCKGGSGGMFISPREAHSRSFAKAVSWRITGSIDTFVLSFIITGSFKFAGSIAVTEMVTKIVLYYLHERAWTAVPWGKGARTRWFLRQRSTVEEAQRA